MSNDVLVIGRVLHYLSHGTPGGEYSQECRPGMVTGLIGGMDEQVHMTVFNPTGFFCNQPLYAAPDERKGGTWHWPGDHSPLPLT